MLDPAHITCQVNSNVEFFGSSSWDKLFTFYNVIINGGVFIPNSGSNTVIKNDIFLNSGNIVYVNQNVTLVVEGNWVNNGGKFTPVGGRVLFQSRSNATKTIKSNGVSFSTVLIRPATAGACTYELIDDMTCTSTGTGVSSSGNSLTIQGNNDIGAVTLDVKGKVLTVNNIFINGNTTGTAAVYHATLDLTPGSTLRIGSGYSLTTANRTPRIRMVGTSADRVIVTRHGAGNYNFNANTATASYPLMIEALYADFEYMGANGINCAGANVLISPTNNFSHCSFTNFNNVSGVMLRLPDVLLNNIENVRFSFNGIPTPGTHFNVFRNAAGSGAATFVNATGNMKGTIFEQDNVGSVTPGNVIWVDQNIYWGPFASGDWNDLPSKWRDANGNVVPIPTSSDNVIIDHTFHPTRIDISNNSGATCKNLTINGNGTTVYFDNASMLAISGNFEMASNSDSVYTSTGGNINIAGSWLTRFGNFVSANSTTVTFSGTSSTIATTVNNAFENVTINCPGNTIRLSSDVSVKRNLNLTNGSLDAGTNNNKITLRGNWVGTNNCTFVEREGIVLLNGTGTQNIFNPNAQKFFSLHLNKTLGNVNLNHDIFILSTLYFAPSNRARVITNSNIVRMQEAASSVGVNPSGINGFVDKRMSFIFKSSASKWFRTYTIGSNSFIDYLPVDLQVQLTNSVDTEILIEQFNVTPPARTLPIAPENVLQVTTEHYFTVTNLTGTGIANCDITLRYNYKDINSLGTTNPALLRIVKENSVDGTIWDNITPLSPASGNASYGFHTSTVNITGFSDFAIARIPTPMPIELGKFEASYQPENEQVQLTWNTFSENNNSGFILKKSFEPVSWTHFDDYKQNPKLVGKGTTTSPSSYVTFDNQIVRGKTVYYQLIQEDFNGMQSVSGIASVFVPNQESSVQNFIAYPNPFSDQFSLKLELNQTDFVTIKIYDITGKLVKELCNQELPQGEHIFKFEPNDESSGIFLYQVVTTNNSFSGKMIQQK